MGTVLDVGDEGIWVTYARGMRSKAVREFKELCENVGKFHQSKIDNRPVELIAEYSMAKNYTALSPQTQTSLRTTAQRKRISTRPSNRSSTT